MKHLILLVLLSLITIASVANSAEIMPLSEVKEGMVGVGHTVFKGNQIEEFQVEILGVLEHFLPQQSLILATLKGGNLEETGVISGMSGSPVFINGKMIGAVAYSWPFSKNAIAGITPIEAMLETQVMPTEQMPIAPPIEISQYYNFENLLKASIGAKPPVDAFVPQFGKIQLTPIATPLSIAGFDPRITSKFEPLFHSFGLQPMMIGTSSSKDTSGIPAELLPGSPVSVQLVRGDFDIGAIGTVTYRDEKKILAFGHPFFNLGPIDFPMATAKIHTVVPSLFSSFKIGTSGPVVGSIRQDLSSAVFGLMGEKAPMIPVQVNLNGKDKTKRSFQFELVNHKLLTPLLLDFAFQNSVLVTQLGYSESTLKVAALIDIKNGNPIQISNIFSGTASFSTASQYVASILYTVMMNDFKNVDVNGVVIDINFDFKRNEAELVEVWLDRNEVHPGERIRLRAVYRPVLGEKKVEEFDMKVPDDVAPGVLQFIAGGGQEVTRQEYAQYGKKYQPDSLEQIISILNSLRSNDRIYVKAFQNEPSLVLKGRFLYDLPSSAYSVLSSSQTIGSAQSVNTLALWEDSRAVDYYLTGTKFFSIRILPKQS